MSLVLIALIISLVIWLFLKLVLIEIPSIKVILGMRKLPGPRGLPFFLGATLDFMMMGPGDILNYIKNNSDIYQRLTAFYLAGIPMIVLHKPEDIKHILGSNQNIKKGMEYNTIKPWLNEGLLLSHDIKWHSRRKMLTPTFHFKILDDALNGMIKNTDILANKFVKADGSILQVEDYVTRCTLDIIGETAMGVQLNAQTEQKNEYLNNVKRIGDSVINRVLKVYYLNDWIYSLSSEGKRFYNYLKVLHGFTDKVIAERKKTTFLNENVSEDDFGRKKKKAFLDSLISMQAADPSFTDKDIREEVDTFMFEGHDTTSAALAFGLWLLGSHQDIQEKLYDEVSKTLGDGEITMANISSMNYMDQVVKEVLRLYPSVPYISRTLSEEVNLDGGVQLPVNSNVIIVPFLLHRDNKTFPDPERFQPERFSEEQSKNRHPYAYIPFSAGPRNCIGQKFAVLEMKVTIASIVRKCKIESITKKEDFKILPNMIIKATLPIECKFIPRTI